MADQSLKALKSVLRSLIIVSPNGITIQQLRKDYMELEGSAIPHAVFGFARLDDFLNFIFMQDSGYVRNGLVYAIKSEASNHIKRLVQEQKPSRTRRPRRRASQNQSTRNYGSNANRNKPEPRELSVRPCNWSSSYQPMQKTESPQNAKSCGYIPADILSSDESSTIDCELFDHSPSTARHEPQANRLASENNFNQNQQATASSSKSGENLQDLTTFKKMNMKETEHYNINPSQWMEPIPFLNDDDEVFRVGLSRYVAKLGTQIAQSTIPKDLQKGSLLEICVAEINNPFRFWFHILNDQYELQKLMNDIGEYYKSCSHDELKLPASQTCIGQLCAAHVLGLWHRAEILQSINADGEVKVYCLDFGTIAMVSLMQLKFLLLEYCTVPSQAFRGCLAFIQPTGLRWKREASFYFLSLVPDTMIYAKVEDIDYENRELRLLLIDTTGENDLQINAALVDKRIAKPMSATEGPNGPMKRHYCERYPTFEMLERSKYPSLAEIGVMLEKGIDYEAMQDENIIPELDISCKNMKFDEQIVSICCELATTSICHEISSDDRIPGDSDSLSLDDISSGSIESIVSMQHPSYPAPQMNLTLQARELWGIVKPAAASPVRTLNSLNGNSRDTNICRPKTLASIQHEISSDNQIQDVSFSVSLDDISSGSFESIVSMQHPSYPAPQLERTLQTQKPWGIVKPAAAILTFDSLDDTILSPRNLHSDSEDEKIISESNNPYEILKFDEQNSSSEEIPSGGSFESNESMQIVFEPERQVSTRLQERELQLPRDTMACQPQAIYWAPEKGNEAMKDIKFKPESDISFQNLEFAEQVEVVASKTTQLDDETTKAVYISSQNIGSTESPELPNISEFVVELPSRSRWSANQSFAILRIPTEVSLPTKSSCKGSVLAAGLTPINNLSPTPKLLKNSVQSFSPPVANKSAPATVATSSATTNTFLKTSTPYPRAKRINQRTNFYNTNRRTYQLSPSFFFPMPFPFQNFPHCQNYPFPPPNLLPFMPNMAPDTSYYSNNPPPYEQYFHKFDKH